MDEDEARKILGVATSADRAEVKRAHRRLAATFHPDRHEGSAQYDDFQKSINVARDTLLRALDRLAESAHAETVSKTRQSTAPPTRPPASRPRPQPPPPPPGVDELREISFPFLTMLRGGRTRISVPRPSGAAREMFVDVPQGAEVGVLLLVPGGGAPGSPPGNLMLRVTAIDPDPLWQHARPDQGRSIDLVTQVSVTYAQVYAERLVSVHSPWATGTIGLPLRANNFGPYRVRGHGVRRPGVAGDLLVLLDVKWPEAGHPDLAAALMRAQSA